MAELITDWTPDTIRVYAQIVLATLTVLLAMHIIYARALCIILIKIKRAEQARLAYVPVYQCYLFATLVSDMRIGKRNADGLLRVLLPVLNALTIAGFTYHLYAGLALFMVQGAFTFLVFQRLLRAAYHKQRTGLAVFASFVPCMAGFVLRGISRHNKIKLS